MRRLVRRDALEELMLPGCTAVVSCLRQQQGSEGRNQMEDNYHGFGSYESCRRTGDQFIIGRKRYLSEEECDRDIHPADRRRGAFAAKCPVCRGWYIRPF
jgi:hypothetical protein